MMDHDTHLGLYVKLLAQRHMKGRGINYGVVLHQAYNAKTPLRYSTFY